MHRHNSLIITGNGLKLIKHSITTNIHQAIYAIIKLTGYFYEILMTSGRWDQVHQEHQSKAEEILSAKERFRQYFEQNLLQQLARPYEPNGEKNQTSTILAKAKKPESSLGILSRIFDTFDLPITPYQELKAINNSNGLRHYMNEHLNAILPYLLNENKTGLNQQVINVIGADTYRALLANAVEVKPEQEVALHFVKAVLLSYGQRVIDSVKSNLDLKQEAYGSLNSSFSIIGNEVTLDGLPEKVNYSAGELRQMLTAFNELLNQAEQLKLEIPNINRINDDISAANQWLDMGDAEKATQLYDKAVDGIVEAAKNITAEQPEEANWFLKMLRFITNNEKLLQTNDEKRYERQIELLPQLHNVTQTINSLQKNQPEVQDAETELNSTMK